MNFLLKRRSLLESKQQSSIQAVFRVGRYLERQDESYTLSQAERQEAEGLVELLDPVATQVD